MAGEPTYLVQALRSTHDRAAFHCGDAALDSYFLERAARDVREKLSAVFVLVAEEAPAEVIGYYTLCSQEIDAGTLPDELKKRIGRYTHLGATLLGRLAVAKEYRGRNLGEVLLLDALRRSLEATREIMSFAVVVDAKSDQAAGFYRKYGFIALGGNRLFLPMKTIERLFAKR